LKTVINLQVPLKAGVPLSAEIPVPQTGLYSMELGNLMDATGRVHDLNLRKQPQIFTG
jgi:hypothetical protein